MLYEQGLSNLLDTDKNALCYFKSLPIDTQLTLSRNFSNLQSTEDLHYQAELIFHTGGTTN